MKNIRLLLCLSLFAIGMASCGNKGKSHEHADKGKEYTSAYICPMHCKDSGSDKPGTCPVCGMDYKKNEDHGSDGHDHEDNEHGAAGEHEGHDHDGHNH